MQTEHENYNLALPAFLLPKWVKRVSQGEAQRETLSFPFAKLLMGDVGCKPTGAKHPQELCVSQAFSLVEMLMALLVASLLMAALAPVMTKRFGENVNVSGTGSAVTNKYCAFINDENSTLVFDEDKTGCIVPDGVYSASAIIASGGGGGGGAAGVAESSTGAVNLVDTNTYVGTTSFNGSTKSMTIRIVGAGGAGGGGSYYLKDAVIPKSQADCEPFGVYISAANNGGKDVCVSKYNPDDIYFTPSSTKLASPEIPSSVTVLPSDGVTTSPDCATGNCCWKPQNYSQFTANKCTEVGTGIITSGLSGMNYSGCHRTMCQWKAADTICKNWKPCGANGASGRLPTGAEIEGWAGNANILKWTALSSAQGDGYGLQLCDNCNDNATCSYGYPWCGHGSQKRCAGADVKTSFASWNYKDLCLPHVIWSDDKSKDATAHLNRGVLGVHSFGANSAFSTRCVIEKVSEFSPFSGGGGSSGTFVALNVPQKVITEALKNGNGRIASNPGSASQGGAAGTASNLAGGKGNNGGTSKVAIYDGTNKLIWSLEVPGGNGAVGGDAANSTDGTAAKAALEPNCKYYDSTSAPYNTNTTGHVVKCSEIPGRIAYNAGEDGNTATGGNSAWIEANGGNGTGGAGGSGKTCEDGDTPVCSTGSNGSAGRIQVQHTPTYPGVGGGGGAAGNVIHITNFTVNKGDLIKVTVGHGGGGGYGLATGSGANGQDGGASFIEFPSGTKYGTYGGQGGRGGKKGEPSTNTAPQAGSGGVAQGLLSGTKVPSDHYFKGEPGQAAEPLPAGFEDMIQAPGGHGGINPKVSGLTPGGSANGIPCGGLNNTKDIVVNDDLKWEGATSCTGDSNKPFALSRELFSNNFSSDVINNFVIGATGGGGGGWMQSATTPAEAGAKGMGGYVYIYFGDWSK